MWGFRAFDAMTDELAFEGTAEYTMAHGAVSTVMVNERLGRQLSLI